MAKQDCGRLYQFGSRTWQQDQQFDDNEPFAAQHAMIWVNLGLLSGKTRNDLNGIGSWLGAMAQTDNASPDVTRKIEDLNTAKYLGHHVAEITKQFCNGK